MDEYVKLILFLKYILSVEEDIGGDGGGGGQ